MIERRDIFIDGAWSRVGIEEFLEYQSVMG
jgi:hypothetical protein